MAFSRQPPLQEKGMMGNVVFLQGERRLPVLGRGRREELQFPSCSVKNQAQGGAIPGCQGRCGVEGGCGLL